MAKQMAFICSGGIVPEAAVNSASSAHIRMAENPASVARNVTLAPEYSDYPSKRVAVTVSVPYFVGMDRNTGAYTRKVAAFANQISIVFSLRT